MSHYAELVLHINKLVRARSTDFHEGLELRRAYSQLPNAGDFFTLEVAGAPSS